MSVPQSVATILRDHVNLEVECLDRLYLNVYVPTLQRVPGVLRFFRDHRGQPIASSALMAPISAAFVAAIKTFAERERVPLVDFKRGQRKDDIAKEHLARFSGSEGVLFIGRAQEKTTVFRTEKRHNRTTGRPYAWIVRSTAIVNQFYVYAVDADFGPFFLKFSSYFPYTGRLCLNGHEWAKRQLAREGIAFEPLDNGFRACAEPERLQAICDGLTPERIDALLRKWLARLPNPYSAADRAAGYRYELSVLQAEVSLTQVFDRPQTGRIFFEEVIRENLDLGRPDQVGLEREQLLGPPRTAARTIAALVVLRDQVIDPILAGVRSPRQGRKPTHWTRLDRDYETIRVHMETLFTDLGITTTATAA